jgi:hypothetical protein
MSEKSATPAIRSSWTSDFLQLATITFVQEENNGDLDEEISEKIVHKPNSQQHQQSLPFRTIIRKESENSLISRNSAPQLIQEIFPKESIPFDKSYDLEVTIDGAVGLPLTATVSRIQAELVMPTKKSFEIKSPYGMSELTSDHVAPLFNLKMRWKGNYFILFSNDLFHSFYQLKFNMKSSFYRSIFTSNNDPSCSY